MRYPASEKLEIIGLVEAALDRLGDRHLTPDQQREVVNAVRDPAEVKWPEWWEVRGEQTARTV
jgi:hypothetical protein